MFISLIFKFFMPLVLLSLAITIYRFLWSKILKPILDKEKVDGAKSNGQSEHQFTDEGIKSDVTKT